MFKNEIVSQNIRLQMPKKNDQIFLVYSSGVFRGARALVIVIARDLFTLKTSLAIFSALISLRH